MLMDETIMMLIEMTMAMEEETIMEEEMTMAKTLIFFLSCILNFFSIDIINFFFFFLVAPGRWLPKPLGLQGLPQNRPLEDEPIQVLFV